MAHTAAISTIKSPHWSHVKNPSFMHLSYHNSFSPLDIDKHNDHATRHLISTKSNIILIYIYIP